MKRSTIIAFAATLAVAIPAGWRWLDADIEKDGPLVRPKQQTILVDDATVTVDTDRGVVKAGDKIKPLDLAPSAVAVQ